MDRKRFCWVTSSAVAGLLMAVSTGHGIMYTPSIYYFGSMHINASGQVAGYAPYGSMATHAFRYDGDGREVIDLGLGGTNSGAMGINVHGQVVGGAQIIGNTANHAFFYDGTMHDLGTLGGTDSEARGINASGQVVGSSQLSGNTSSHAFLYDGTMHDLGTLGGTYSEASAINASGQVVGSSQLSGNTAIHAFFYDGTMHDLGTLGGTYSSASAINSSGQVVGQSRTSENSDNYAFFYDGTMHDLTSLLSPDSGWTITHVYDINDNGWIVATGTNSAFGYEDYFLLLKPVSQPAPEPASLGLLGLGIMGLLVRRRGGGR